MIETTGAQKPGHAGLFLFWPVAKKAGCAKPFGVKHFCRGALVVAALPHARRFV
jgi:hypothetical protein